jgi:putative inorganic carbon (hco3(-)) transporter
MSRSPGGHPAAPALAWVQSLSPSLRLAVVVLALMAAILPGVYALPALAGLLVGLLVLVKPELAVYLLVLSVPLGSLAQLDLDDFSVSSTEVLVGLLVLGWGLRAAARRRLVLPMTPLTVPIALMLLVVIGSIYHASSPALAVKESLKWLQLAVVYLFIVAEMATARQAATLVILLMVGAAIEAFLGLAQFTLGMGPDFFAIGRFMRAYGTFDQPNPYAGYLGMLIPIAVGILLTRPRGKARRFILIVLVLAVAALAASLSRGAWVGIGLALAVMMLLWSRRSALFLTAGVIAATPLAALTFLNLLPAEVTARLSTAADYFRFVDARQEVVTSQNWAVLERVAHWQAALDMIAAHPLRGVGAGNYPAVYEHYMVPGWLDPLGHAHNYYLNIAAETGIPGLLIYLTIPTVAIVHTVRWLIRSREDGDRGTQPPRHQEHQGTWRDSRPPMTTHHSSLITHHSVFGVDPLLFWRGLLLGVLGTLIASATHNMFDSLFVHGMSVQLGMILALGQLSVIHIARSVPGPHHAAAGRFASVAGGRWRAVT